MRLDTVVIGMDFSPSATTVATWVAQSLAPRAKLALVHAIEPPARPSFLVAETLPAEALEEDALNQAMDRLREVARDLGPNVSRIDVRVGRAADVIRLYAVDACADLIVVGPHGNRTHPSVLLGTTTDNLVRGAPAPVLVGPRAPLRGRTRVVAGVIETAVATRVLAWANLATRQLGGRLTTLYAIEPAAYVHMASVIAARSHGDVMIEERELDREIRLQAHHWLTACTEANLDPAMVDVVVQEGLASDVILQRAADERAALIILGGHESLPALPPRLGRTVRNVLHEARAGVLIVPPT